METFIENKCQNGIWMSSNIKKNETFRTSQLFSRENNFKKTAFEGNSPNAYYQDVEMEFDYNENRGLNYCSDACSGRRSTACPSRRTKKKCQVPRKKPRACRPKLQKPMRLGPLTNNPYLNYLRDCRRKYIGLGAKQIVVLGAYEWRTMCANEKARYRQQACGISYSKRKKCC